MIALEDRFRLRGKIAAIAGGEGQLGSALSRAMAESGMTVYSLDRARAGIRRREVAWLRCNVTEKRDVIACRTAILKRHGRIDVLLNAAGANAPTPALKITAKEFHRIVDVNLLGTLYGCQVFGETMVKQRCGSIINFSSVSLGPPLSKAFAYSAAKAGVYNLTQNLAREWAPFQVRVNALRPGFFPTAWSLTHFIDRTRRRDILRHTPMGRFGKPEELIGAVLWLASDAASFVTGSLVTVDGGFTAMTI
ncbi:MAG: SDR family oxidoreductase [Candidatus Omnitrophica bacterium]|nr:SDR family oxidoreductase [Candidatus Omnitrophota bacterium]